MNRFASAAVVLVAGGLLAFGGTSLAHAQAPGGGTPTAPLPAPAAIPADARTSAAPEAFRPQIEAFVKGNLARLRSTESKTSQAGREALIAEATAPTAGPGYKDLYAQTVATALQPMLADKDARTRVLAGVLAGRLAEKVDNAQLAPVAVKLLQDSNLGVQIWGMKTARGVLAYQITQPGGLLGSPVAAAVANTAAANAKQPELARDAADALHVDIAVLSKLKVTPANVQLLVPHVLKVLDARAALYKDGLPEDAEADQLLLTFFSNKAWAGLTPPQRAQAVQRTTDLLLLTAAAGADADTAAMKALTSHAVQISKNILIIAEELDKKSTPATKALLKAAEALSSTGNGVSLAPADLQKSADAIYEAIVAIPEYKAAGKAGK